MKMNYGHELDFASGYFTVFPCNFKDPNADQREPYLYISEKCPPDIRERLLEVWPRVKEETKKRHETIGYSSLDYF